MTRTEETQALATQIESWVNGASLKDMETLAVSLTSIHRTLQQSLMSFVYEYLRQMSDVSTDARNEIAVRVANAAHDAMNKELNGATRLPVI